MRINTEKYDQTLKVIFSILENQCRILEVYLKPSRPNLSVTSYHIDIIFDRFSQTYSK